MVGVEDQALTTERSAQPEMPFATSVRKLDTSSLYVEAGTDPEKRGWLTNIS